MSQAASNSTNDSAPSVRADTLAASVAILLAVTVVQRSIGFMRGVLFCRWLSPDELGVWELSYSFLLLAAPLTVLGLPGSFGRYLERYRQRQQLRTFLRRSAAWVGVLATAAVAMLIAAAPFFSQLIFGSVDQRGMVILLALSLAAVILHHFLEAVFAALRMFRVVSAMHVCQSLTFAATSLTLILTWNGVAETIVISYGAACLVSASATLALSRRIFGELLPADQPPAHADFWPPLVRFAVWIWVANLFSHLFAIIDRWMIVHTSGMNHEAALATVGQYHSSCLIPVLFVSVADLLAGAVMPYLSHDWEAGRRREVSARLNLVLKLTSLGMMAAGTVVLWAAPLLFKVAFDSKYNAGLVVLPWTLACCLWQAIIIVAQNYVWCAERTRIGVLPLVGGVVLNVALNLVLLPIWGLLGAVVATTIATGCALAALHALNRWVGMELHPGTVLLTFAPLALAGGPWVATVAVAGLAATSLFSPALLTSEEKNLVHLSIVKEIRKATKLLSRRSAPITSG